MSTDLSLVASRLSRAADLIEKRAAAAEAVSPSPWIWDGEQEVLGPDHVDGSVRGVSESVFEEVSALQAAFDPRTVAALVPLLLLGEEEQQ